MIINKQMKFFRNRTTCNIHNLNIKSERLVEKCMQLVFILYKYLKS